MPRYVELAIGKLPQLQRRGWLGQPFLKKVTHVAVHPVNCADMSADGSNKFLDAKVLARLMGQPLLSRFPMEGTVSGQHKSFHRGSPVRRARRLRWQQCSYRVRRSSPPRPHFANGFRDCGIIFRARLRLRTTLFQQRHALLRRQWLIFSQNDCSLVKLHLQNISRFQLSTVANFGRKDDFAIGRQGRVHKKIKALPAARVK